MSSGLHSEGSPPTGTVTFLLTDIEDSTRLWEAQPARMAAVLARHDALCREVVGERRGRVVKTTGDGLYAAFDDPFEALSAAIELQRGIQALARESDLALKMRCGVHCGAAEARDGDYFGPTVNCAARVMDAAHGGQVLVTQALVDRVGGRHPEGADLLHLGRVRLRGVSSPVDVWQVRHADLRSAFPPLRTLDSIPHNLPRHATSFVGREEPNRRGDRAFQHDEPADTDRRRRLREVAARVGGGDQPARVVSRRRMVRRARGAR